MPGSFDYSSDASQLGLLGIQTAVYRYDGESTLEQLPNVTWTTIQWRDGIHYPVAQLVYIMDDTARNSGWPTRFDELLAAGSSGPFVLQPDDRVCIYAYAPDGSPWILFDGHCQIPQADVSERSQTVTVQALGVAARCWDLPIGGRVMRPGHRADESNVGRVQTSLPTRFNPTDHDGKSNPNSTKSDVDESVDGMDFPLFIDHRISRDPDPRAYWTLSGAVRYLLAVWNDEEHVSNPPFGPLDDLLKARSPKEGSDYYDPEDSSTYDSEDIILRDYDATNKPWPEAMAELLGYSGFGMSFRLGLDENGLPDNFLDVYRLDADGRAPKPIWLDEPGTEIDLGRNMISGLSVARDLGSVVNEFIIETPPRRIEVSVILAPGFTPASGDESAANRKKWLKSKAAEATADERKKYRVYVADECGDGYYDTASLSWTEGTAFDFKPLFPDEDGVKTYVERFRPGRKELLSKDTAGRPRVATLAYSQDYAGDVATLWDGSGTWTEIGGGWKLLDDRLGIECTCEDPEQWPVGKGKNDLRGVTWQAAPPAGKQFYLRLTTVIDDDIMMGVSAEKRPSSPTQFTRTRRIDARDHFEYQWVHSSSQFYSGSNADPQIVRDDSDKAEAHARALRAAHEFPPFAGSVTIPFITMAYMPGDRIDSIAGRDISLRSNAASGQGEAPAYPVVVSITFQQSDRGQFTRLQLHDFRADPQRA